MRTFSCRTGIHKLEVNKMGELIDLKKLKEEEVALVTWLQERKLGRIESKLVLREVVDVLDMLASYSANKKMDELEIKKQCKECGN